MNTTVISAEGIEVGIDSPIFFLEWTSGDIQLRKSKIVEILSKYTVVIKIPESSPKYLAECYPTLHAGKTNSDDSYPTWRVFATFSAAKQSYVNYFEKLLSDVEKNSIIYKLFCITLKI